MSLPAIFDERERLAAARATAGTTSGIPKSRPLPGVVERADVLILRVGTDPLPTTCPQGHRGPHNPEPPLDGAPYGTLTCRSCGRLMAWLQARPRPIAPRRSEAPPRPTPAPTPRPAPVPLSTDEWRLPGCTVACRRGQHAPGAHEAYGRQQALCELEVAVQRPDGQVRTGALTVDFDSGKVTVLGNEATLTEIQEAILFYLAARVGRLCLYPDVVCAVWGAEQLALWSALKGAKWQAARMQVMRLRGRLGPAADLLDVRYGRGLRLRDEPTIGGES